MTESPASYLRRMPTPREYQKGLEGLRGSFSLETEDMVELGSVYFELYPEAAQHRNNEQVLAGYEIVRISIFEKLTVNFNDEIKKLLWRMVKKSSEIPRLMIELLRNNSIDDACQIMDELKSNLHIIQEKIEAIPRGEIRERFMGGVAVFPNTIYLFNMALEKQCNQATGNK